MSCQAILESGTILRYIIYVLSWKLIWNGWQLKEKKTYKRERERERERQRETERDRERQRETERDRDRDRDRDRERQRETERDRERQRESDLIFEKFLWKVSLSLAQL